jgi:hypothetical protein
MNDEGERVPKDAVVAHLRCCPGMCWREREKPEITLVIILNIPAEIRTEHVPNASLEHCHYKNFLVPTVSKLVNLIAR